MKENLEAYLEHVRQLPFVKNAFIREPGQRILHGLGSFSPDTVLEVKTGQGTREFLVELKKTHLTYALADGLIALAGRADRQPFILFARSVPRKIGRYLGERGINYVDQAGNCRFQIGADFMAVIEGRPPIRIPAGRGIAAPGYRVLFTILAEPELLNAPVRTLAEAAAVSKTTAAETIARLVTDGLVSPIQGQRRILDPKILLDRWVVGYETMRPRLIVGRFKTQDADPAALEERLEKELGESFVWAWGGGSAAMRITKHYHGEETVVHVCDPANDLPRRLRALPAIDGPLIIQHTPNKTAFNGVAPHTVHPLLIFAELMASINPRARDAALEIREAYIKI